MRCKVYYTRIEMTRKPKKIKQKKSVAEKLSSTIKSARNIMRKDKGLNGELDRLRIYCLTWTPNAGASQFAKYGSACTSR